MPCRKASVKISTEPATCRGLRGIAGGANPSSSGGWRQFCRWLPGRQQPPRPGGRIREHPRHDDQAVIHPPIPHGVVRRGIARRAPAVPGRSDSCPWSCRTRMVETKPLGHEVLQIGNQPGDQATAGRAAPLIPGRLGHSGCRRPARARADAERWRRAVRGRQRVPPQNPRHDQAAMHARGGSLAFLQRASPPLPAACGQGSPRCRAPPANARGFRHARHGHGGLAGNKGESTPSDQPVAPRRAPRRAGGRAFCPGDREAISGATVSRGHSPQ